MNQEVITGANIVQHIESIEFDSLKTCDLEEVKEFIYDRIEMCIRRSTRCASRLDPSQINEVSRIITDMVADCITVLHLGNEVFFRIDESEGKFVTNDVRQTLSIVTLYATDIIHFVEDIERGDAQEAQKWFAEYIGHEVCHTYIFRNFPAIAEATARATAEANDNPLSEAYKNDPGENACNVFGNRYTLWKLSIRN
jgi:hypothetical protein